MDEEKEYPIIRERKWISKEETKTWFGMKAEMRDGLCYFEDGTIIDPSQPINDN